MSLVARQRRLLVRFLHASARRRDLIGPPDPVTNLRPVIYENEHKRPQGVTHPYSLHEFDPSVPEYELRWRLERAQMDTFNHDFWTDNNTRFEVGKKATVDALPDTATPEEKDRALSEFYAGWLKGEAHRHATYTKQWRRRNRALIALEARVLCKRLAARISSMLPFRRTKS